MQDCIFCKIVQHEQSAEIVLENEQLVVFKDVNPKAPVHLLIVPRKHIDSVNQLAEQDKDLVSEMILTAKRIAQEQGIAEKGYRLIFNVGKQGGQLVDHIHLHLLGGAQLGE